MLPQQLIELLKDPQAAKVVATIDGKGIPHVVFNGSLTILDDQTIAFAEELDSSKSAKNMVNSIWFEKTVAIAIANGKGFCYQIKGKPIKCLICGPLFKKFLLEARQRDPEADIQSVWLIKPEEVRNYSPQVLRQQERQRHPYLNLYLDKLAIQE